MNLTRRLIALAAPAIVALTLIGAGSHAATPRAPLYPQVKFTTSAGDFVVQLNGRKAPLTTRNFLKYVESGHYNGTIFHRVISGFMAQGGGYDTDLTEKPTRDGIPNESGNGLSNAPYTLAMARTGDPHSASAQFFVNLADNSRLDPSPSRWGYAVFGEVVEGKEVIDALGAMETGPKGRFRSDVPKTDVVIKKAFVLKPDTTK
ncbi:MAG: peptidylprolyl isomerase [Gammaproteobacteria bacterium]